jgi:hypothetical protein
VRVDSQEHLADALTKLDPAGRALELVVRRRGERSVLRVVVE